MAVGIKHLGVFKVGRRQGFNRLADVVAVIATDGVAAGGIAPVVHHLGHSGSDTSHDAVLALIDGALQAVGQLLTPKRLDERSHALLAARAHDGGHLDRWMSLQVLNLLLVAGQECLQALGQVVEVQVAVVAISQHGCGTVLAGNDDITAACDVEGIVGIGTVNCCRGLGIGKLQVRCGDRLERRCARQMFQELIGIGTGSARVDIGSPGVNREYGKCCQNA